jgi:AcrR family transcriptional regulator
MIHIMSRGSVSRAYDSPLRAEQMQRTREQILDGLLAAMQNGLADLSIPAVALAAQVSVPTVYRHFPNKRRLFEALAEHVTQRSGMSELSVPRDLDGLHAWIRDSYVRLDTMDPMMAAAMAGTLGSELRRKSLLPGRMKVLEVPLAPTMALLPPKERAHLRNLLVVLTSSAALRTFKGYLGLAPEQAAETVAWGLRALVDAAELRARRRKPQRRSKRKASA